MLLLFETAAGFALFKVVKEGKLEKAEVRRVGARSAQVFGAARSRWDRAACVCRALGVLPPLRPLGALLQPPRDPGLSTPTLDSPRAPRAGPLQGL